MTELDITIDQRKQGMIAPDANMLTRANLCATLTHYNAASGYQLTVKALDTKHFWFAVTTVARATHTFFMCHDLFLRIRLTQGTICTLCLRLRRCSLLWLLINSLWSLTCDQALALGEDIIDTQDRQLLAMTATMAITLL